MEKIGDIIKNNFKQNKILIIILVITLILFQTITFIRWEEVRREAEYESWLSPEITKKDVIDSDRYQERGIIRGYVYHIDIITGYERMKRVNFTEETISGPYEEVKPIPKPQPESGYMPPFDPDKHNSFTRYERPFIMQFITYFLRIGSILIVVILLGIISGSINYKEFLQRCKNIKNR